MRSQAGVSPNIRHFAHLEDEIGQFAIRGLTHNLYIGVTEPEIEKRLFPKFKKKKHFLWRCQFNCARIPRSLKTDISLVFFDLGNMAFNKTAI